MQKKILTQLLTPLLLPALPLGELAKQQHMGLPAADQTRLAEVQQAAALLTILSFGTTAMAQFLPSDITAEDVLLHMSEPCHRLLSALLRAHSSEAGPHLLHQQAPQEGSGGPEGGDRVGAGGSAAPGAAGIGVQAAAAGAAPIDIKAPLLSKAAVQRVLEELGDDWEAVLAAASHCVEDVKGSLLFIEQHIFQGICEHGQQDTADKLEWKLQQEETHAFIASAKLQGIYDELSLLADKLLMASGEGAAAAEAQQQQQEGSEGVDQLPAWLTHLIHFFEEGLKGAPAFNRWGLADAVFKNIFQMVLVMKYPNAMSFQNVLQQAARQLVCGNGNFLYTVAAMVEAAQVSMGLPMKLSTASSSLVISHLA